MDVSLPIGQMLNPLFYRANIQKITIEDVFNVKKC